MSKKRMALADTQWKGVAHVRIRSDVLNSPAWRVLPFSARSAYLDLRAKLTSVNNGDLEATPADMVHRGWKSKTTLYQALGQLEALGFIAKTRQGGKGALAKSCSLWRFTDLSCFEQPKHGLPACKATFEWRAFATVGEAAAVLDKLTADAEARKKTKGQKLTTTRPEIDHDRARICPSPQFSRPEFGRLETPKPA